MGLIVKLQQGAHLGYVYFSACILYFIRSFFFLSADFQALTMKNLVLWWKLGLYMFNKHESGWDAGGLKVQFEKHR